jgi:DNA-binding transcriptional ArsR family regulator
MDGSNSQVSAPTLAEPMRHLKHQGTLDAVAQALAYSQSTVSQQLSLLEAAVGVPQLQTGLRCRGVSIFVCPAESASR